MLEEVTESPSEWHNHDEYEADVDTFGYPYEDDSYYNGDSYYDDDIDYD